MQKDAIAITGGQIWLTTTPALYDPNKYDPPEKPLPVNLQNRPAYIPPEIVDADTLPKDAGFMTNDLAIQVVVDGKVPVNIDSVMKDIAPEPVKSDEPVVSSQEPPEFPGGPAALIQFIGDNTKYPAEAIDINLQGKVIIKFAVWSDGSVRRIEVLRGVSPILDQEAIRVVSTLPKWKPGKQNGVPVSVWFSVPVTFRITSQ
jgi:protein TonB